MKKIIISLLTLAAATAPALADEQHHDGQGGNHVQGSGQAPQVHIQQAPQAPQNVHGNWEGHVNAPVIQNNAPQGNWNHGNVNANVNHNWQGNTIHGDNHNWQGGNNSNWNHGNDRHDDHHWDNRGDHGQWTRDWRHDQRYDWQNWRNSNRGYFHLPRYYNPYGYGYGYNSWAVGAYIDSLFFGQDYWINDPYYYHLPPAYGDTRWIRYYNDAILVDIDTGQVVDVIHNFFW